MNKPLSVSTRLIILVVLAVIFGATMIGLSMRNKPYVQNENYFSDNNKNIEKTFSVKPDGKLIIDADVGNITVNGSGDNEVSIRVVARGNEDKIKKYDVSFDQEGNTVTVKGELKRNHFRWFGDDWLDVQFEVNVPKNFNLNLHTSGGNIEVQEVKGKMEGETSGGNLELTDIEGDVKMSTSGGNVTVQKASGEFSLETSGGNMIAEKVTGPLHLETSGGNIEIKNSDGKVDASTSGGNIRATLKDNKGIELTTSGGNITVEIPRSITADVKAEASGGDVSCDLEFSGKIKDGTMNGKINGGGNIIRLETSGGDIMITPGD